MLFVKFHLLGVTAYIKKLVLVKYKNNYYQCHHSQSCVLPQDKKVVSRYTSFVVTIKRNTYDIPKYILYKLFRIDFRL